MPIAVVVVVVIAKRVAVVVVVGGRRREGFIVAVVGFVWETVIRIGVIGVFSSSQSII